MSFCRICLDDENTRNLIYPCRCRGTSKYVHYECLEEWRVNNPNIDAQVKCMECKSEYRIVNKYPMETFIISYKKLFLFKTLLHPFVLILPMLFLLIGIENLTHSQTSEFLDYILFTNITYNIQNNIFEYISYYYILSASSVYVILYLTFLITFFLEIKRKCKYATHLFIVYFISLLINSGYIYLYLVFSFNIHYYFIIGLFSPILYYYTFILCFTYFHNDMIDKLNTCYNKRHYLHYDENRGIVDPTFEEIITHDDVFLIENTNFNEMQ